MKKEIKVFDNQGNVIPQTTEMVKMKMQFEIEHKPFPGKLINVRDLGDIDL